MKYASLFLAFFLGFSLHAQLSGTYLLSASGNGDFSTMAAVIDTLDKAGISGNTEIQVDSGFYFIDLQYFNQNGNDTLRFVAKPGLNHRVRLARSVLGDVKNVYLQGFYFIMSPFGPRNLLTIRRGENIHVQDCHFLDTLSSSSSFDAIVEIYHPSTGSPGSVYIEHSTLHHLANDGNIVYQNRGTGESYFYKDSLIGNFDSSGSPLNFSNCYVSLVDGLRGPNGYADSCTFVFRNNNRGWSTGYLQFERVSDCLFTGVKLGDHKIDTLINCRVENDFFALDFHFNGLIEGNVFLDTVRFSRFPQGTIQKNLFHDRTILSSISCRVQNNFFYGELSESFGNSQIVHNNFGPQSHILSRASNSYIANNLINTIYSDPSAVLSHNNYRQTIDFFTKNNAFRDPAPSFYDPQFISNTDLHLQNPLLMGTAKDSLALADDIDGQARPASFKSRGADENCLKLPLPDSLYAECGTEVILKTCATWSAYRWQPAKELFDSTAAQAVTIADRLKTLYLVDSLDQIVDSIAIVPKDIAVYGQPTQYAYCGFPTPLSTYLPQGSSIQWEPSTLVLNDSSAQTYATINRDTSFVATITTPHCGVYYDTVHLRVDPVIALGAFQVRPDSNCHRKQFKVLVPCKDSLLWSLGDGGVSRQDSFTYTYAQTGRYTFTLEIWRDTLYIKLVQPVVVSCLDVPEQKSDFTKLSIFPNPSEGFIQIEYSDFRNLRSAQILSLDGRMVADYPLKQQARQSLQLGQPAGIYLLRIITSDGKVMNQKISVHRNY